MCFCKRYGCGNCKSMPTEKECLCCLSVTEIDKKRNEKGVKCITLSSGFQTNCFNIDVLKNYFTSTKKPMDHPKKMNKFVSKLYIG